MTKCMKHMLFIGRTMFEKHDKNQIHESKKSGRKDLHNYVKIICNSFLPICAPRSAVVRVQQSVCYSQSACYRHQQPVCHQGAFYSHHQPVCFRPYQPAYYSSLLANAAMVSNLPVVLSVTNSFSHYWSVY